MIGLKTSWCPLFFCWLTTAGTEAQKARDWRWFRCVFQICLVIQTWYITNALEMFVFFGILRFCMVIVAGVFPYHAGATHVTPRRPGGGSGSPSETTRCDEAALAGQQSLNQQKAPTLKTREPMLLVSKCWSLTRKALIGYWHTESLIHSALSSVPTVSGPV